MFDLEQQIVEWRQRMLAAGIRSPVPLDELEGHLREEVERQVEAGVNAEEAFVMADEKIGRADTLRVEFRKIKTPKAPIMNKLTAKINSVLASIWLALCGMSLITVGGMVRSHLPFQPDEWAGYLNSLLAMMIYMAGITGSLLLFRGSKWGYILVRMAALLLLIICLPQLLPLPGMTPGWRLWCGANIIFDALTIWLLWQPKTPSGAKTQPS